MKFELDEREKKLYNEWKVEATKQAIEHQKKTIAIDDEDDQFTYEVSWEMGFPYCGAIGGEYSFKITPTSLGPTLVVINNVTGEELNLTDFDSW